MLCKIGPAAVKPLILALKDDDPDMRGAAAAALGTIGDVQALKPLTFVLKDEDERVRRAVVWSLRRIAPLVLTHPLQRKRKAAAWVLGRVGTVQAVPALIEALKRCEDEDEQGELITALVQLGGRLDSVTLKCNLVDPLIDAFLDMTGGRYNAAMTVLKRLGWEM
jgi:HEAT repeat protein